MHWTPDRKIVANGGFSQYVGDTSDMLNGANDKPVGKAGWGVETYKGEGSMTYGWINPLTHQTEPKVTLFEKGEDDVAAYNPSCLQTLWDKQV
jgi:hypothetical protein